MKRRTQKLFIAMFAFLIAGFAITSAYVFDVTNWNPFGTLNLSKLIIKNLSQTGIILDSEDYTIKIDPDHNDPDGGQIRVYQICDENGQNCRAIANLYTGTQGVPGPQGNTGADGVGIQDISSEKVGKTTTVTVTYTNGETLSFDILDGNDGTSVNGGGMAFTNNSQNNYICWKSGDAVTCNGLKLSTYPQNNRLCYVKDNVLYCDQENLFDELSGRIVDVNDGTLMIYVDGSTYKTFSANQTGSTTINISPTGLEGNICVKNASGFIRCDTSVKIGTMVNGRICTYSGGENKINCNTSINNPGSAVITLQTKSGDVVNRSGSFDVNQTTNETITIPSGGGGVPGQKGDKGDPGENGVSVTNAYIDGNNIVFGLSDNSTITLENALRKGDQGPKGDTGAVGPQGPKGEKGEAGTCEGQCTGSGDGITVSGVTLGGYCRYITQELLDILDSDKANFFDLGSMSTENGWVQCTFTGGTTTNTTTQSITIDGTPDNICVKVSDNTINCNIPLEDLQGGTGTTEGSGLWTSNSTQTVIYPASYTKSNVAIGTNISSNYTLNVNGSGWIQKNLKLGSYLYFEGRPITRNVFNFKQSAVAQKSSPVIEYYNDLLIRPLNIVTDYRTNNYITLGKSGNVGIGGEYSTGNYKLSVYGRQRIYAENSGLSKYIDIYNDGYTSYVTSKWSFMKIGLIGDQDYLGAPLPSSYIYFGRDSVGVNIEPTQNTYNPSNGPTSNGYYVPRFQVNGSIQIKSEYEVTNKTQELNRFKCRSEIEGTIAYWSGQFYGCAKTINGTQINYKRRVFDTTSLAAGDAIPAPIDQTLSN